MPSTTHLEFRGEGGEGAYNSTAEIEGGAAGEGNLTPFTVHSRQQSAAASISSVWRRYAGISSPGWGPQNSSAHGTGGGGEHSTHSEGGDVDGDEGGEGGERGEGGCGQQFV